MNEMELTKQEVEDVLKKYIQHIEYFEGIDYLSDFKLNAEDDNVQFTEREVQYLSKLNFD